MGAIKMTRKFHERLLVNRWLLWVLALPLVLLMAITAMQYSRIESETASSLGKTGSLLVADQSVSRARILNDYEDFYIVGRLYREGDILKAYNNDYLLAAQAKFTGTTTFMPWAYPPHLTALTPILPLLGLALSYAAFMLSSMVLYFYVTRLFGAHLAGAIVLAIYPALLLNVRLGQNGFLTGALIGLFLHWFISKRRIAGVPLGLLAIKPHLAVALGFAALLQRRWTLLIVAFAIVLVSLIAATLVLSPDVWPAFIGGVKDAGGYLSQGLYPLYRMSSVYACVRSFGLSPQLSMAVHAVVALAALAMLAWAAYRQTHLCRLAALATVATVLISPYNYDYDLVGLSFALALVLPELLERMRFSEAVAFYALTWIATGSGLVQHFNAVLLAGTTAHPHGSPLNWSFQALGVICAAAFAAWILNRPEPVGVEVTR